MLGKRRGESRQTLLSNKMLKWQRKFHLSSCPAPNRSPLIDDFEIIRCELCLYAIRIGRVAHRNKREMSYGQIPVSQNDLGNDGFIFKQWRFQGVLSLCFFSSTAPGSTSTLSVLQYQLSIRSQDYSSIVT